MMLLSKKYIPFICLILSFVVYLFEGLIVDEGWLHSYLYMPSHVWFRYSLRVIFALLLFVLGYLGLNAFNFKWLNKIWVIGYGILLIINLFYKICLIAFNEQLPVNVINFFSSFINILSPFPFLFLLIIALFVKRNKIGIR